MWLPSLLWATSTLCSKAPLSVLIDLWGAFGVCVSVCMGCVCACMGGCLMQSNGMYKQTDNLLWGRVTLGGTWGHLLKRP